MPKQSEGDVRSTRGRTMGVRTARSWRRRNVGDEGAARRVALSSAGFRAATFPITATATFLTTALVIGYVGPTHYGALMVIATLSQLIPFADLGIGAGVINAVAQSKDEGRRALAAGIRVLSISSLAITVIAILVAFWVGWPRLLSVENTGLDGLDLATAAAIVIIAISVPLGLGQRLLVAQLRNPLAIALAAIAPILSLLVTFLIVTLELPASSLVLTAVTGAFVSAAVMFVVGMRGLQFRVREVFRFRTERYPGLLGTGLWYLLLSMSSALVFQSGRVILAHAESPAELSAYSLVMQFYMPIWSFLLAAGTGIWPIFARRRSRGEDARRIRFQVTASLALAATGCGTLLVLFGPQLASWLSSGNLIPHLAVFLSASILLLMQGIQLAQGVYLTSPTGIRFQALCGLPLAVLVPSLVAITAGLFGAIAPFAVAAAGVFFCQIVPNYIRILRDDRVAAAQS